MQRKFKKNQNEMCTFLQNSTLNFAYVTLYKETKTHEKINYYHRKNMFRIF